MFFFFFFFGGGGGGGGGGGFLLFSMVNIFETPGRPCMSDVSLLTPYFAINTNKTLKLFVLGNIETGILVDFTLITIFWPKLVAIMDFEVPFDI